MGSEAPPPFAVSYPNLALERLGTRVEDCSDEFFAPAVRLLGADEPVFIPGKYDEHGKWMDGWETRRRRQSPPDHDWLQLELGAPASIHGLNLSTRHFTGNYPQQAEVEAIDTDDKPHTIASRFDLTPDSDNWHAVSDHGPWKKLKLKIYPDGGIARLRVHGHFVAVHDPDAYIDLASIVNGARVMKYSDAHFGAPINMLLPDGSRDMGDGWETARRRGPGNDWALIKLGCPGAPDKIVVDTSFFKGNYPDSFRIQAADLDSADAEHSLDSLQDWPDLVAETKLQADHVHEFALEDVRKTTHLLLSIYPDGGVARLRVYGKVSA